VAVPEKIARLESFIAQNPAMADVPALMVAGRPTTLREALDHLRAGRYVSEVMSGLGTLGLDVPWQLCQEFYRRLMAARPETKIYTLGFIPPMSPGEALRHVEARDETGRQLVEAYASLLGFIRARVNV
jgi:hypothetical protein